MDWRCWGLKVHDQADLFVVPVALGMEVEENRDVVCKVTLCLRWSLVKPETVNSHES